MFYTLKKYKAKFGDPKDMKVRVVSLRIRGKGVVKGCIVREEEDGVFPIRRSTHIDFEREYVLDDGKCVLDGEQMNDMLEIGSDLDDENGGKDVMEDTEWAGVPSAGVLSLEETASRAQAAADAKGGKPEGDGEGEGDDSDSDSSGSGDGSGDDSDSESRSARSDDEVGTVAPKAKKPRTEGQGSLPGTPAKKGGPSLAAPLSDKKTTPQKGGAAGAADDDEEAGEKGEKDFEAEALMGTMQSIISNFSAGAFVSKEGRAGQELQRTWKGLRP